jgi:hypothetical protein
MNKTILIVTLIILLIILLICGCNSTAGHSSIYNVGNLGKFKYLENMIGCTIQYSQNNFNSFYRILPVPKTHFQYQQYKMINSKLGKYYEQ